MAGEHPLEWFADDQVPSRVLDLIRDAEDYVHLVSPYVRSWGHLRQAVELASKRPITVQVVVRKDPDGKVGGSAGTEAVQWLLDLGAEVKTLDSLHSKIYLSEKSVIVSSMNLLSSSSQGSHEFGIAIPPGPIADQVREYVSTTLMGRAQGFETKKAAKPRARRRSRPKQEKQELEGGACIRCGSAVKYDPGRPLCDDCYKSWAVYGNEDYAEKFCHLCGKKHATTYALPLCRPCFRKKR